VGHDEQVSDNNQLLRYHWIPGAKRIEKQVIMVKNKTKRLFEISRYSYGKNINIQ